ncbi:MAG: Gfo/Idh/MocA family oxidoreductase [Paucibacter sp.]|nr:Gfo/Idh/MocA family oxidoreductase [Roseateles sp.]
MNRRLRVAMIGGGKDAFIGAVHRHAMALDGHYKLVSGALSSSPEKSLASGRELGLASDRNHPDWHTLLADEQRRPANERVDLVVIVTPNHLHYEVAKAFVDAGFNVACDKPLVHRWAQAEELAALVKARGTAFAVTYNYTGYPMVREARELVRSGVIGKVRKAIVEYHQGWLAGAMETSSNKQSSWRTDPAQSGPGGALGDIGTHAENLLHTITGQGIEQLCAELSSFGAGRTLDDDASVLLRLEGGARGVLLASQMAIGHENDLRIRVFGERGSLSWQQEDPNVLVHAPLDEAPRKLTRGSANLSEAARRACRLPPGHPEGFIEAFANLYTELAADLHAGTRSGDYPRVEDGARGVRFVERAVASNGRWIAF